MFNKQDERIWDPLPEQLNNPDVLADWYNRRDKIKVGFTIDVTNADEVIASMRRLSDCMVPVFACFKVRGDLASCLALIIEISAWCKEIILEIPYKIYKEYQHSSAFVFFTRHLHSLCIDHNANITYQTTMLDSEKDETHPSQSL